MRRYMEDLEDIVLECYRRLFAEAEPSADFDAMMESGETQQDEFFMRYYLDDDRQEEIIQSICDKHNLTDYYTKLLRQEIMLGCSPNGCRETWEKLHYDQYV